MTEISRNTAGYGKAQEAAVKSLRKLATALQAPLSHSFKYRLVSQAQAASVEREYFDWVRSGKVGAAPTVDPASERSAIYNQAAAAKQLDAFLHVSRVVAFELCEASIQGFEGEEVTVPFMMLRSLVERIAHVAALAEALKPLAQTLPSPAKPNEPLLDVGDKIGKALYGTKVDWLKLGTVDLRAASKEDIAYFKERLTMDVTARSVLSTIDKLDKRVPGVRIAYDVLCEFLHPNVGDLYATTVRASSQMDIHGTRHLIREIGLGPKDLSTTPDLAQILSQVLSICSDSFDVLPLAFDDLHMASRAANKMARKFAHRVRRRHRPYFQKDDLCPCLSGFRVGDCR
jgi:hypothetical protein